MQLDCRPYLLQVALNPFEHDTDRVWKTYIIDVVNHRLDTSKKIKEVAVDLREVAITWSDKLNGNGIETIEMEEKMTNVKEEDEVYAH